MEPFKAFIIDDEYQGRNLLKKMLQHYLPEITIAGEGSTVEEGLEGILQCKPDIVFLDIQMKGETGFDLLKRLPEINFALIITTAFDEYAIKAFRVNAVDYLLKPIVTGELIEAVKKARQMKLTASSTSREQLSQLYKDIKNPPNLHNKIALPSAEGFVIIPVNEIVYCHANSNYTEFHMMDKKCILSSYTLKQYDEILSSQSFFRVHRSYLVNLSHVKLYRKGEGGEVVMSNGHEIEVSRNHKDEFLHLLNIR